MFPPLASISSLMTGPCESVVVIEHGALDRACNILAPFPSLSSVIVVTDEVVAGFYGHRLCAALGSAGHPVHVHVIPAGERSKSLAEAERLYDVLAGRAVGRDGLLVALGGGVVSDLAGFVAATWKRGVDFAVFPTTLEAAVDAAIGGKTGVNLAAGKNLVGAFHWPRVVAIDPATLATLPQRDLRAGMAESIKHALIADADFATWHENHAEAILQLDAGAVTELIRRNVAIKSALVKSDPLERTGVRRLLNFGHTLGHAIERAAGYALRHGECVAIGMVAACRLSHRLGMLGAPVVQRVENLIRRFELPLSIPPFAGAEWGTADPVAQLLGFLRNDKKASAGAAQWVLLEELGRPVVRGDVPDEAVAEVCRSIL